jgi:hypothetical protein
MNHPHTRCIVVAESVLVVGVALAAQSSDRFTLKATDGIACSVPRL